MQDILHYYYTTRQKVFEEAGIEPQSLKIRTEGPIDQTHYLTSGSGTPLLIIHGGGSHSSEWINIIKPLSARHQLFVVDKPGYGLNAPFDYRGKDFKQIGIDFISAFQKATGIERFSILANSIGAFHAINYSLLFPEYVENLILIGAPAGTHRAIPLPLRLMGTPVLNSILMHTVAKPSLANTRSFHKQIITEDISKLSDSYLEHTTVHMQMTGKTLRSMLTRILTFKGWKEEFYIGDQIHKLQVPVGFIWGRQDAFDKPENGKPKTAGIPNCRFEIVEGAGHCPWLDKPEECTRLILDMLETA